MKKSILSILSAMGAVCCSSQKELTEFGSGNIKVCVEAGDEWKHPFNLFMGIKKKNDPQIAIWTEDMDGNYLSTIYVSRRIATQTWIMAGGNRRKEALPYWSHRRGVQYDDGLYLPDKKNPLPDSITGATPSGNFDVRLKPEETLSKFVIKAEFNHSTDFNDAYPKSAEEGDADYSGGSMGSGQPAVVYEAVIDTTSGKKEFKAMLAGHSSPDGSDGELYKDLSTLTTAVNIVKEITIRIQ